MHKPNLRSPLSRARGLGSARSGTGAFIAQRVTAIALVPLSLWFVISLLRFASGADHLRIAEFFASSLNASAMTALLIAGFYHAKIGIQAIIDDYVHCTAKKIIALLVNSLLMWGSAIFSLICVIKLHLSL